MSHLNDEHIEYIRKDLHLRGIVLDGFEDEIRDHICSAVETEMDTGRRFIDAYHLVLKSFGHTTGLRRTQQEILRSENKPTILMLSNYITIAIRYLKKYRFYSLVNITGLAVGIASCLILALFVAHELSFDRYHEKATRIYRVNSEIKFGSNHFKLATGTAALATLLRQNFPEIESAVRFRSWGPRFVNTVESADHFKEPNVVWADSTFFTIFSFPLLAGDPSTALKHPNTIAISKKMADKYFPQGNALGQSLIIDKETNHKVTAVFKDMPRNSHFHFEMIMAMSGLDEAKSTSLVSGGDFYNYLLLKEGADAKQLEKKVPALIEKHIAPQLKSVMGGDFTMAKFVSSGNKFEYTLTPLTDIHLHSHLIGELKANGNITYINLFSAIGLFILVIACINFMNLSTARSANRSKEVGIRKVLGTLRSHLIRQFLVESILLTLFAFVLGTILACLFLPFFNELAQQQLSIPFEDYLFYVILLSSCLLIGLLAGLYPSFFLSSFKPINALKGKFSQRMKTSSIRSSLVVFQFVVSIFLIIGTITINRQLNYIQNKKLGFVKDQVIVIHDANALGDKNKIESFKHEITKNSFIKSGTISGYLPVEGTWRSNHTFWGEGVQPTGNNIEDFVSLQKWSVDADYIKTMGMKVIAGRDFLPGSLADSATVILNETAVKQLDFQADPLGKKLHTFGGVKPNGSPDTDKVMSWTLIGVVEDFHFASLKEPVKPLAFFLHHSNGSVSFRFGAASTEQVTQVIEDTWRAMAPGQPFRFSFLDEDFSRMYANEQRLGKAFTVFAFLAIIIASLGLFALTAFTAEQRTKEIGIRKVLGATVSSIVFLLSREFGKLIFIAFILSAPLAWFAVDWWLKNYTYRTEVGVFVYVLAGACAFLVAWLTMSFQSIKAATSNPVNSLRSE